MRRPMSIASAPEEGNVLEFYIRYVNYPESDNPLTHLLWKTQAGDRIYLRSKAVGKFTVPDTVGDDESEFEITDCKGDMVQRVALAVFPFHPLAGVERDIVMLCADMDRAPPKHRFAAPALFPAEQLLEQFRAAFRVGHRQIDMFDLPD